MRPHAVSPPAVLTLGKKGTRSWAGHVALTVRRHVAACERVTELGNLLGALDRHDVPEFATYRVWIRPTNRG